MLKLLAAFPTSWFTGALAFCLTWWLITTIFSGIEGDADTDIDADADLHGGGHGNHLMREMFGIGFIPLPLALTILAFGAWSISLVLQLGLGAQTSSKLAIGVGLAVMAGAAFGGFALLRLLRKPVGRLFEIELASDRHAAVGSTCKVRTLVVNDRLGDAEVLTGPTKGSLIKVRAQDDRFTRGDVALIVDYDPTTEAFTIDDIDEDLKP